MRFHQTVKQYWLTTLSRHITNSMELCDGPTSFVVVVGIYNLIKKNPTKHMHKGNVQFNNAFLVFISGGEIWVHEERRLTAGITRIFHLSPSVSQCVSIKQLNYNDWRLYFAISMELCDGLIIFVVVVGNYDIIKKTNRKVVFNSIMLFVSDGEIWVRVERGLAASTSIFLI